MYMSTLLVDHIPVLGIAFSHQREDVITDDSLGKSNLTVAEVVYRCQHNLQNR
jgi:hypothetical protein